MEEAESDARREAVLSLKSLDESMADNVEENHDPEVEESDHFQSAPTVTHTEFDGLVAVYSFGSLALCATGSLFQRNQSPLSYDAHMISILASWALMG